MNEESKNAHNNPNINTDTSTLHSINKSNVCPCLIFSVWRSFRGLSSHIKLYDNYCFENS